MTSLRFEITAPAERDLEEIFFEVKDRHGLLVAERVYDNLADRPRVHRLVERGPERFRLRNGVVTDDGCELLTNTSRELVIR